MPLRPPLLALVLTLAWLPPVQAAQAVQAAKAAQEAAAPPQALPTFAAMEAVGARIGRVVVVAQDIFDTRDPEEDRWLFRLANRLHIQTQPEVIERALLFKSGEPLSVRLLEETERLLRSNRYLHDVRIVPVAWKDGVVDIEVRTQDTWSLEPGASVSRAGGSNTQAVGLREHNLLGTGISASLGFSKNVDRSSTELSFFNERAFGTGATLGVSHANNSDGRRSAIVVQWPFQALDTRWAGGFSASDDSRIDSNYSGGELVAEYRHRQQLADVNGGWSTGLVNGWVQRTSVGLALRDDRYAPEPGRVAPAQLAADQRQLGPYLRHEWIEDRVQRDVNRNLVGRPEFFALGLRASVQLGWAAEALSSSSNALLFDARVSRGMLGDAGQMLVAGARLSGQWAEGEQPRQRLQAQVQAYRPQGPRWLLYGSATLEMLSRPEANETLQLGGDNGLRGYPLRYQNGNRRLLFTAEERFYTDYYPWRLFRLGGAVFADAGRAWGGAQATGPDTGWLGNVGAGLRIVSARSAFSNVLHVDVAVPIGASANIKKLQFLLKTKASF